MMTDSYTFFGSLPFPVGVVMPADDGVAEVDEFAYDLQNRSTNQFVRGCLNSSSNELFLQCLCDWRSCF